MTEDEIGRLGQLLDEKMSGVDRHFDELHRHFDVVAENLQGQIQQVAEGVVLGNERLDRVEVRLEGIEGRLDRVEVRLDGIDGRLDHLETAVHADFSEVKSMVKLSFAELDRRLTTLETIVHDLTGRLERLETRTS